MLTSQCGKPPIKVEVSSFVWRVQTVLLQRERSSLPRVGLNSDTLLIGGKLEFQFSHHLLKSIFVILPIKALVNGKWKIPYKKNTKASTANSRIIIPSSKAVDEDLFSFNFLSMVIVPSWSKRKKINFPKVDYRQSLRDEFW